MAGAAVLVAKGALAAGAGLITLLAPRGAWPRLASLPPEVMCAPAGDGDTVDGATVLAWRGRATAWAVGPGLGGGAPLDAGLAAALATMWAEERCPAVWDADALATLSGAAPGGPRVITPHPGEAARLLGADAAQVEADRFGSVARLVGAAALPVGSAALLKGPGTIIAAPGRPPVVLEGGTPALATAGSGDVLTGVIAALLARGMGARSAAVAGAALHARAGVLAGRGDGTIASDIIEALPEARAV
jgi:hydroxyethylthiazole kinase-like uncharacterized protein yjeF